MDGVYIYGDDLQEIMWFKSLDERLSDVKHGLLRDKSTPEKVENLLKYDVPDIIITYEGEPVLVLEKSSEVPTGHNMGQRFGRMVRAAEEGVPGIMFFPYLKTKHGKHASACWANARYFKAMWKVEEIHESPFWSINWPCDDNYELINDGSESELLEEFIQEFISNNFSIKGLKTVDKIEKEMQEGYETSVNKHPQYESLPRSVKIVDTDDLISEWSEELEKINLPERFKDREETLVYKCNMSPSKCRREDPYVGMQFVYDYGWCRKGENVDDKYRNLVLKVPKVSKERWAEANPNDYNRKSSQWYATAEAIRLNNSVVSDFNHIEEFTDQERVD